MFTKLKKKPVIRKLIALLGSFLRFFSGLLARDIDYYKTPPVLVNSFPKSGTHLLLQIAEALPYTTKYDSFIASMPSFSFRERTKKKHIKLLKRIVPGEIVTAHLFYDPEYEELLNSINCAHIFIYRDLRDVAISEAYYLTNMNKWHKMHEFYVSLSNDEQRISLAIMGLSSSDFEYDYPNIAQRFSRYAKWLKNDNVLSVRFEDLIGEKQRDTIKKIVTFYISKAQKSAVDVDALVERCIQNINPERSHTFRSGKTGGWERIFTIMHHKQIAQVAGELLHHLGYERQ